jgi:subtilisin family serine protease
MNGRKADGNGEPGATGASGNGHPNPRNMYRERYLVAARAAVALPGDTGAPAPGRLAELLEAEPGVRVLATIGGPDPGIGTWSPTGCPAVLAVEAPPAGPVMFPANLPTVLSVGAIGRAGTFPTAPPTEFPGRLDLRSAQNPTPEIGPIGPDGLFVPGFTAGGPEVDVCAPGVAVVSTVPTDGYAVVDGTGVAAAHITAVAALVLAHHEDFRARYTRGPARVDRLAQLIISSCRPVGGYGTGAGLPDARFALAAGEHAYPGWADSLLGRLQVDLTRAGFIPSTPGWPPRPAPPR